MSVRPLDEPERLRVSFARELHAFASRERAGELVLGIGFVLLAAAVALWAPASPAFSWPLAAGAVLMLALASRVRFDFGAGFTVPIQLVLVPMLFALPPWAIGPL